MWQRSKCLWTCIAARNVRSFGRLCAAGETQIGPFKKGPPLVRFCQYTILYFLILSFFIVRQIYQYWRVLTGFDNFLQWQKIVLISIFTDLLHLKLCDKEGHPQRPDMRCDRGNPAPNDLPSCLISSDCHGHWYILFAVIVMTSIIMYTEVDSGMAGSCPGGE